jgi:hypothetical protein
MAINMQFLRRNYVNTTTQFTVDSGTDSVSFLFDGTPDRRYLTDGYTSNTTTLMNISLPATLPVSNVLLQGHNLKSFRVFYNGVTASSLLNTTTNSATSTYLAFNTISTNSIQIQMNSAFTSGERYIGELYIGERLVLFPRNPDISDYKPVIKRKQIRHVMPDGGTVLYNIREKFNTRVEWEFINNSFVTTLANIYNDGLPFHFVPFATSTGWDGNAYEVVWPGDFDFNYTVNDKLQGYSGRIILEQTANV